ncbi:MAG: hypothetical protein ACUVS4_08015, partial [Chloroflexaceae bacterium]
RRAKEGCPSGALFLGAGHGEAWFPYAPAPGDNVYVRRAGADELGKGLPPSGSPSAQRGIEPAPD